MNEKTEIEQMIVEIRSLIRDLNSMADKIESNFIHIGENESANSLRACAGKYQNLISKLKNQISVVDQMSGTFSNGGGNAGGGSGGGGGGIF